MTAVHRMGTSPVTYRGRRQLSPICSGPWMYSGSIRGMKMEICSEVNLNLFKLIYDGPYSGVFDC